MIQQNFLNPTGFSFVVDRLPNVSFFVHAVIIPSISMSDGGATIQTPFKDLHFVGNKIEYGDLRVSIRLDEFMESYTEIANWLVSATRADSYDEYANLSAGPLGVYSDGTIIVLDSAGNPGVNIHFKSLFPTGIGDVVLDTSESDILYPTVIITFKHNGYTIQKA
jgi:hypothetical protein